MKNNSLNTIYNYINNYDLITVIESDKNGKQSRVFYTTGIKIFRNNLQDIAFKRFCSVPVVLNNLVKNAEILHNGNVLIDCGELIYTLIPQKEKVKKATCKTENFLIDIFIDKNMIDTAKITVKNKTVFVPVDYKKIGETTSLQEMKIKLLIDNILDGAAEKYQCCRVPAFSVEFYDNDYKINGHIYNIVNGEYLNTVLLYDSKEDINKINPYSDFMKFAKDFLK